MGPPIGSKDRPSYSPSGAGRWPFSDVQLELLEGEPGVSNVEVAAESGREPWSAPASSQSERQRRHPGRQQLPANLPRVERVISCTPEQSRCQSCGQPMEVIGYEQSEQLDVEPTRYFVLVSKREKRACRGCQQGVATAPARIIDKALVSDRVVIDTVIWKYCDHLPLYRQSVILERETGIEISRATLALWPKLKRFLDYPELELSNNLAENSIRPVAIGRKNWIHVGSPEAGPRVAAILSIVETCRRISVPVRDYLAAVLPGLADVRIQKLAELTPAAWAARN